MLFAWLGRRIVERMLGGERSFEEEADKSRIGLDVEHPAVRQVHMLKLHVREIGMKVGVRHGTYHQSFVSSWGSVSPGGIRQQARSTCETAVRFARSGAGSTDRTCRFRAARTQIRDWCS